MGTASTKSEGRGIVGISIVSAWAAIVRAAPAYASSTLFVDDNAPLGGDGQSWDTAYRYLQDALVAAQPGSGIEEIHVGQGVYEPDQDEGGNVIPGARSETFQLIDGVALRGGYAGYGAADPDDREIETYETILTGDLLGNDGEDFELNDENSYHVTTGTGVGREALLEGFTISKGTASGWEEYEWCWGGGLYNSPGSPTVRYCTFTKNSAEGEVDAAGGGICNRDGSEPLIEECLFITNRQYHMHGGGGAIANLESAPTITGCQFIGNSTTYRGGAIFDEYADSLITYCVFQENTSYNDYPDEDAMGGAGIYVGYSSLELHNCVMQNLGGTEIYEGNGTTMMVEYSCVAGGFAGNGNIDADPLFIDPDGEDDIFGTEDDNLRIGAGSPCIDAADNTALPGDITTDLDGNPRFVDDPDSEDTGFGDPPIVDMSAYEFQVEDCPADVNEDDAVDIDDLFAVLGEWGPCDDCPEDINDDGTVDIDDVFAVLADWGPCP